MCKSTGKAYRILFFFLNNIYRLYSTILKIHKSAEVNISANDGWLQVRRDIADMYEYVAIMIGYTECMHWGDRWW